MRKFWFLIAVFFCCTTLQAQTYELKAYLNLAESTDAPAGAEAQFVVLPVDDAPMPFMYEWFIVNNEDSSLTYHGYDDSIVGMTPLDARDITIYVNVYDMMANLLGTTNTVDYKWLPPVSIKYSVQASTTYTGAITLNLAAYDSKDRVVPGRFKVYNSGSSIWVDDEIPIDYNTDTRIGVFTRVFSGFDIPFSVNSELTDSGVTSGTLVDKILMRYYVAGWDWLTDTWATEQYTPCLVTIKKGSANSMYVIE